MSGALVKRAEGLLASLGRRGARGRATGVPPPRHLQRGRGGHASASAPQRARGARRRSPGAALRARHLRSPPPAQLRSRPDHQEPDGRDLTRGVAHRVDPAAELDRRGAARRPRPTPTRGSDARMDRRRPRRRRTSCEAVSSNRCTAGSPPPRCSCPPPSRPSSMPASPNATEKRRRSSNASSAPSTPNAASGSAVVNSSIVGLVAVLVAALAVFGTVQWRSAARRQRRRGRPAHGRRSRGRVRGRTRSTIRSSPCCWRCSPCAKPSTSGSRPRRRSMQCTSRSKSSGVQYDVDRRNARRRQVGTARPRRCVRAAAARVDGDR